MGDSEWGTVACSRTNTEMNSAVGLGLERLVSSSNFLLLIASAEVTEFSFLLTCLEPWPSC